MGQNRQGVNVNTYWKEIVQYENGTLSTLDGTDIDLGIPTVNDSEITVNVGNGLTGGGSFTTDQASDSTITINVDRGVGTGQIPYVSGPGLNHSDWVRAGNLGLYGTSTTDAQSELVTTDAIGVAYDLDNVDDTWVLHGDNTFKALEIPDAYELPKATGSTLGGVIIGDGLSVSDGTISVSVPYVAPGNGQITINTGAGLTGSAQFNLNDSNNQTFEIDLGTNTVLTTQANTFGAFTQVFGGDVQFEGDVDFGAATVSNLSYNDLDDKPFIPSDHADSDITIQAGTGLSGGGTFNTNETNDKTISLSVDNPVTANPSGSGTSALTKLQVGDTIYNLPEDSESSPWEVVSTNGGTNNAVQWSHNGEIYFITNNISDSIADDDTIGHWEMMADGKVVTEIRGEVKIPDDEITDGSVYVNGLVGGELTELVSFHKATSRVQSALRIYNTNDEQDEALRTDQGNVEFRGLLNSDDTDFSQPLFTVTDGTSSDDSSVTVHAPDFILENIGGTGSNLAIDSNGKITRTTISSGGSDTDLTGDVTIGTTNADTLTVRAVGNFNDDLNVYGDTQLGSSGGGDTTNIYGTLNVSANTIFSGEIQLNGDEPTAKNVGDTWVESNDVIIYSGGSEINLSSLGFDTTSNYTVTGDWIFNEDVQLGSGFGDTIDVRGTTNFVQRVRYNGQSTDPGDAVSNAGELYYNTTDNEFRFYDGTEWAALGSGSGSNTISIQNGNDAYASVSKLIKGDGIDFTPDNDASDVTIAIDLNGSTLLNGSDGISLNLGSTNTWTGAQTFGSGITVGTALEPSINNITQAAAADRVQIHKAVVTELHQYSGLNNIDNNVFFNPSSISNGNDVWGLHVASRYNDDSAISTGDNGVISLFDINTFYTQDDDRAWGRVLLQSESLDRSSPSSRDTAWIELGDKTITLNTQSGTDSTREYLKIEDDGTNYNTYLPQITGGGTGKVIAIGSDGLLSAVDNQVTTLSDLGITATSTEINYSQGVTSAIQTQLDGKQSSLTDGTSTNQYLKWDGDSWEPATITNTDTTYTGGDGIDIDDSNVISVNAGDGIEIVSDNVRVDLNGSSLTRGSDGIRINYEGHNFIGNTAWSQMHLRDNTDTTNQQSLVTRHDLDNHTYPTIVTHSGDPNTLANLVTDNSSTITWRVNDSDGTSFGGSGARAWFFQPLNNDNNDVIIGDTEDFQVYNNNNTTLADSTNSTVIRVVGENATLNDSSDFNIPTYLSINTLEPVETYIEIRRRPAIHVNWGDGTTVDASPNVGSVIFRSEVIDVTNGTYTRDYEMSLVEGQTATFEKDDMILVTFVIRSTASSNVVNSQNSFFSFGALDDSNHDWSWTLTTHHYDDIFELEDNGDIRLRINDGDGNFDDRKLYDASSDRWFGLPEAPSSENTYELDVDGDGNATWVTASGGGTEYTFEDDGSTISGQDSVNKINFTGNGIEAALNGSDSTQLDVTVNRRGVRFSAFGIIDTTDYSDDILYFPPDEFTVFHNEGQIQILLSSEIGGRRTFESLIDFDQGILVQGKGDVELTDNGRIYRSDDGDVIIRSGGSDVNISNIGGGSGISVVTSDPSTYDEGDVWYNSTDNVIRYATTDDDDSNANTETVASEQYVLDHADDAIEHLGTYANVAKNDRNFTLDNDHGQSFNASSFGVNDNDTFIIEFSSASDLNGNDGIVDTWDDLVGSEVYIRFTNQDDPFAGQSVYRISPSASALDNAFVSASGYSHVSGPNILAEDADGHGDDYRVEIRSSLFHIDVFDSNLDGLAPKRGNAASDALLKANGDWEDLKNFDDLDDAVRAASFNYVNIRSDNPNHTYTFESSTGFNNNQFGINGSGSFVLSLSSFDNVRASDWGDLSNNISIFRLRRHDDSRVGYYRCSGYTADDLDFLISGTSVTFIAGDDVMNDSGEDGVAYYIEIPNGGAGISRFVSGHDGIVAGPSSSEADKGHLLTGDNTWTSDFNKHLYFEAYDNVDGSVDPWEYAKRNFNAFKAMDSPAAYDHDYYEHNNTFYYQSDMSSVGGYSEGGLASIVRTAGYINNDQPGFVVKVFRYNSNDDLVREDLMYIDTGGEIVAATDFRDIFDTSRDDFTVGTWASGDDDDRTPVADSDSNFGKLTIGDWRGFDLSHDTDLTARYLGSKHYLYNDNGDLRGIEYTSRNDSRV